MNAILLRALRLLGIFVVVLIPIVWWRGHWQSVLLLLTGAVVSASGIWEWRTLLQNLNARMDRSPEAKPMAPVVGLFFLRLTLAGVLLYVSLKCLDGSVYALLAGLALSMIALAIEAFRTLQHP